MAALCQLGKLFNRWHDRKKFFDNCPPGNKSNVWFLVDNQSNIQPGHQKRTYYDDCGTWDSSKGRTHIQDYLISDNFRVDFNKKGVYCIKQRQKGKVVWTPIQPQPDTPEIITMLRYETVLKTNNQFKKHVSWFKSTTDNKLSDIALYEYSGQYKINSTDKVRTNPKTIQQIKTEVQTKKPKDVYLQMNRQLTSGT